MNKRMNSAQDRNAENFTPKEIKATRGRKVEQIMAAVAAPPVGKLPSKTTRLPATHEAKAIAAVTPIKPVVLRETASFTAPVTGKKIHRRGGAAVHS